MLLYWSTQPLTLKLLLLTFTTSTVWPVPSYWLQKLAILWLIYACALLPVLSSCDPHTPSLLCFMLCSFLLLWSLSSIHSPYPCKTSSLPQRVLLISRIHVQIQCGSRSQSSLAARPSLFLICFTIIYQVHKVLS